MKQTAQRTIEVLGEGAIKDLAWSAGLQLAAFGEVAETVHRARRRLGSRQFDSFPHHVKAAEVSFQAAQLDRYGRFDPTFHPYAHGDTGRIMDILRTECRPPRHVRLASASFPARRCSGRNDGTHSSLVSLKP